MIFIIWLILVGFFFIFFYFYTNFTSYDLVGMSNLDRIEMEEELSKILSDYEGFFMVTHDSQVDMINILKLYQI